MFPYGCRVQVSALARAKGISRLAPSGVVVGHSHRRQAITVRRLGRRSTMLSYYAYWERVDHEQIEEHW